MSINCCNNEVTNNNFLVQRTNGANDLISVIDNTQNVAAHTSSQQIQVAGDLAGDAFTTWCVGVIDGYGMGIDNSDSNKLKITYSSGPSTPSSAAQIMISDTLGRINYPLQPSFQARLTNDVPNATGNSTLYTVIPDTITFDQAGDYDNITGTFIAPVTGRYLFTGMIWYTNTTIANGSAAYLISTNREYRSIFTFVVGSSNRINFSHIVDMDVGDTANMAIVVNGEAGNSVTISSAPVNAATYFAGHLLA